ncbi:esterase, PHB depolymerase family [Phyllobacterium sp. YR620]|uniref:extracellular catalytic domain type 1 short-chain-length polyhydroxyalkanoate depolymerase n=1 Tax=Phyllobacterium sp. YR620 TaxID=1881066 RepID=UPI00088CBA10|nr:PHB depolymerase family esterase [Phyllobacterium sp. YR620]SDP41513.1 esterase, PHB depolymerase family [Phyllobacterium sp. YR620]
MRNIADTIRRLNVNRMPAGIIDAGGSTRLKALADFGQNPGELRAWHYIPASFKPGSPLVVVLHGCTQTAAGYDRGSGWSELADTHGFALLFPEQQRGNNANLCFNWFNPGDVGRGQGEVESIRQMLVAMSARYPIDRSRTYITGLSAGGAMAAAMLSTYPELFKAGAIIAGLPFGTASTIPEAFDRMRGHGLPESRALAEKVRKASGHAGSWPAISVWHGSADTTVDPVNMEAIIGQWWHLSDLDDAPTITSLTQKHQCRTWRDANGVACIEAHTIKGMAHGTPIKTGGIDGYGAAGPFMLDVGVSSTWHIADTWNLITETERQKVEAIKPALEGTGLNDARGGDQAVGSVIENALRAAGLMR